MLVPWEPSSLSAPDHTERGWVIVDAGGVVDLMVAQILKDIFLSVQVALSTEPMKQFFF